MKAVFTKIGRDIQRRRMQTAVVAVITLLASAMATISLTLVVRSTAPFDDAFARASGAHLVFHFDAAKVSPEAIRATSTLPVVAVAGDPHPTAVVPVERGSDKTTLDFVGRDDPGGRLDRIQLLAGRWAEGPGEVVVTRVKNPEAGQLRIVIGDTIHVLSRRDRPVFKVVGEAIGLGGAPIHERVWVREDQVAGITDSGISKLGYEMGYRVHNGNNEEGLRADALAIKAALPKDSETVPTTSWLAVKAGYSWIVNIISGALLAFTAFALLASALIVANAITGAVIAGRREIGIMKAVGFTPWEVVFVFVGQMLAAALLGSVLGVVVGILACQPLLNISASSLSLPPATGLYWPVDLGVVVSVLSVVAAAALIPSLRAGSTNAVKALALGLTPPSPGRARIGRALDRLHLPRQLSVGVDDAFLRPMRGILTVIALVIGVATLTFAVGFRTAASGVTADRSIMGTNYDVGVQRFGAYPDKSVMATIEARPETETVLAIGSPAVTLAGLKDPVQTSAIRGDAERIGFHTFEGRWYHGPGEAIAAPMTMSEAHLTLGQTVEATIDGHPVTLRIVGVYTDFTVYDGRGLRFDWSNYGSLVPDAAANYYEVKLHPRANAAVFAAAVLASEPHFLHAQQVEATSPDTWSQLFEAIMGIPALLLVLIAMVGVFNTMLLNSRERSFDIAVLKALGMSGGQVLAMVVAPSVLLGLIGSALGLPAGVALHRVILDSMAQSVGGGLFDLSHSFPVETMLLILLFGVIAAVTGALLPGLWAARAPVATVLRAE